jgi:ABC-type uncharacterized transport system auxiliary subunit
MTRTILVPGVALVTVLALIASGCLPHKVQYYQLSAVDKQVPPAGAGPLLLVARIATPQALQDGRIRYREGPNEVGVYEYHRWTDPPGIMVRDSLIQILRASGRYKSVEEMGSSAVGDYSVRGKLLEFAELDGPGIQTRISLDLELREIKTGRLVWSQLLTRDDPVEAKKVSDVVQSLDRNLRAVLDEAAAAIGQNVNAHPLASR